MSELICENVSISYRKREVLRRVDLVLSSGMITGITGDNGSGKSTLAAVIAGVIKPDGGKVTLDSEDIRRIRDLTKHIGYMPQTDPLPAMLTVRECLGLWCESKDSFDRAVSEYGFEPALKKKIHTLSGGERKRLSFACCAASYPKMLILDEPTAGLDEHFSILIREDMIRIAGAGTGIMLITHDGEEMKMCNTCYRIRNGVNEKI